MCRHHPLHCILPPNLLRRLLRHRDADVRAAAAETLELDHRFRIARAEAAARRGGRAAQPVTFARVGGQPHRTICEQNNSESQTPGRVVRSEGQDAVKDEAANQAYDGLGATYTY